MKTKVLFIPLGERSDENNFLDVKRILLIESGLMSHEGSNKCGKMFGEYLYNNVDTDFVNGLLEYLRDPA